MALPAAKSDLFRHYKGGLYRFLFVSERHTHNGDMDAIYISLKTGKPCSRPYNRDSRDEDSWTDSVTWPDGTPRQRFLPERFFSTEELEKLFAIWGADGMRVPSPG